MRELTILLFIIVLCGCNQKVHRQNSNKTMMNIDKPNKIYGEKLIDSDYLKYADNLKIDSLKERIRNEFDIYDEDNYKIIHIDAEELAEFNFDFFLSQLNKILGKRGVHLMIKPGEDYEKTNNIIINDEKFNLYSKQELDKKTFWDTAPRHFFKKINEILKAKDRDEQFYLLYGGNDLQAILLTEKQFSIISEYYKSDENEKPYKP